MPIEIATRELDSRLLLSLMAVNRGMEVVLGQKWLLEKNYAAMPPGLVLFKTLMGSDALKMRKARKAGHMVVAIDEEVPAFGEGSGELLWVSDDAVRLCDRIFCLGQGHRDSMAAKWPGEASKLVLTGNPRWDFLRPELRALYQEQADVYRARYGRIILINTNSGNVNPANRNPEDVFKDYVRTSKIDPHSEKDMAMWNDLLVFESANFSAAPKLAKRLAAEFPDHTVVLRPHPSENLSSYAKQLQGEERIKVVFEGSAAPWILASDVLIHTDCTTGIEAFALGKPAVCFETVPSIWHEQLLSGRLSFTVQSENDVVGEVARILAIRPGDQIYPDAMRSIFRRFFTAQEGPLAAARVIDAGLEALGIAGTQPGSGTSPSWRPSWTYRTHRETVEKRQRKFPPMDHAAIRRRMETLAGLLGLSDVPAFVECGDNLIHLYSSRLKPPKPVGNIVTRALSRLTG